MFVSMQMPDGTRRQFRAEDVKYGEDIFLLHQRLLDTADKKWQKSRPDCPATASKLIQALTPRQLEILRAIDTGQEDKKLASSLGISARTLTNHKVQICAKLGLTSLRDLRPFLTEIRLHL